MKKKALLFQKYREKNDLANVNWSEMKALLKADHFDNGRNEKQLQRSFENSYVAIIAYDKNQIIGTARALSDGVCNAYIVDVWTLSSYRKQGIATQMMEHLFEELNGQHVYLFTDDAIEFYQKVGFSPQPVGLGKVIGHWLQNDSK